MSYALPLLHMYPALHGDTKGFLSVRIDTMEIVNTEKRGPKLWRRQFTRNAGLDHDILTDEAFRKANFLDYFGRVFLTEHWDKLTYTEIIMEFFKFSHEKTDKDPEDYEQKYNFQIFCAADGAKVVAEQSANTWEEWSWLNQHIRFVSVVSGREVDDKIVPESAFEGYEGSFTIFIVGSESPESRDRFMDATCWDGKMFRFYARDWMQEPGKSRDEWQGGWVYQGASVDAFSEDSYLGPFGGHVNGSLVMKELHRPWPHWHTHGFPITQRFPRWIQETFAPEKTPYISDGNSFDQCDSAEQLEIIVKMGIENWMTSRAQLDFKDKDGKSPRQMITGMKRWIAHVLLTTTVNISVAQKGTDGLFRVPHDFAYNSELASMVSPISAWFPKTPKGFLSLQNHELYDQAITDLRIATYHVLNGPPPTEAPVITMSGGALGGGKDGPLATEAIQTVSGEGQSGVFTMLQPSFEDAQAVITLTRKPQVISPDMLLALIMIDACNPIFSWRRGVLLQYVPDQVKLIDVGKYDLEAKFVENIRASPRFINDKDKSSPEAEFIEIFESISKAGNKDNVKRDFHLKMANYWEKVHERMQTKEGITEYLKLVQSKHRIYRPVPLNEFALTLPYTPNWTDKLPLEMTYEGKVETMPNRGAKFFMEWLNTLMGPNPQLIPRADANDANDEIIWTLGANIAERSMTVSEKELVPCRRRQACPVLRQSPGQEDEIAISAIGRQFLAMMTQVDWTKPEPLDVISQSDSLELKA